MGFKDIKRAYIIEKARELLLSTSIQEVTIKDVAIASSVGEATIYRYFQTKEKLVTEVAIALQKDIVAANIKTDADATGCQRIESFYNIFLNVYILHQDYYRFLTGFDSLYLATLSGSEYPNALNKFKDYFIESYKAGIKDGSLRAIERPELFYYGSTHSLLELCKKLAALDSALPQDLAINKEEEIKEVIHAFLSYLQ